MSMCVDPSCVLVPREPDDPSPDKVYLAMAEGEPYTVGELVEEFPESNRWTIKRRLDYLVEEGFVEKKDHSETQTTYWVGL